MQKIRISIVGDTSYIRFRYNPDVVEVMRLFHAHWDPKTLLWSTPTPIIHSIYNELKSQRYDVRMIRIK